MAMRDHRHTQLLTRLMQTSHCRSSRKKGVPKSRHENYLSHFLLTYTTCEIFKKRKQKGAYQKKQKKQGKPTHSQERTIIRPDLDVKQLLELSVRKFKITIISMLKVPTEKLGLKQDQMGISAERKHKKKPT